MPVTLKPAARRTLAILQPKLQLIYDIQRTGDYEHLGQLSFVQFATEPKRRLMDLRKFGPMVARAKSANQLLLVSKWEGIPPHIELSEVFCSACQATCANCQGKGFRLCEQCGGTKACSSPAGPKKCDACNENAIGLCRMCKGKKFYPTGRLGGSSDWLQPICPVCGGRLFEHKEIPVPLKDFECGRIGTMVLLGPVDGFSLLGSRRAPTMKFDVLEDADGDGMLIVLEKAEPPCSAYLVGGIPKQVGG